VYQVLEEMLDNGSPLISEPNALQSLVAPPSIAGRVLGFVAGKSSVSEKISSNAMSVIPWRRADVKYARHEIYVDIVERIDCILDASGEAITNEVRGTVFTNSKLGGTPDVTFIFSDPRIIMDASLHPCVRYGRFERERVASFIPPDGEFKLLEYRHTPTVHTAPIYFRPDIKFRDGSGTATFNLGMRPMAMRTGAAKPGSAGAGSRELAVEDVVITIHFPSSVKTVNLSPGAGSFSVDAHTNVATWNVGRLSRDRGLQLSGRLELEPGLPRPEEGIFATINFVAGGTTVSGLGVKDVLLSRETYKFYKGVRATLRAGRFEVRCS
jgi:AP-3 complex subunit mu